MYSVMLVCYLKVPLSIQDSSPQQVHRPSVQSISRSPLSDSKDMYEIMDNNCNIINKSVDYLESHMRHRCMLPPYYLTMEATLPNMTNVYKLTASGMLIWVTQQMLINSYPRFPIIAFYLVMVLQ